MVIDAVHVKVLYVPAERGELHAHIHPGNRYSADLEPSSDRALGEAEGRVRHSVEVETALPVVVVLVGAALEEGADPGRGDVRSVLHLGLQALELLVRNQPPKLLFVRPLPELLPLQRPVTVLLFEPQGLRLELRKKRTLWVYSAGFSLGQVRQHLDPAVDVHVGRQLGSGSEVGRRLQLDCPELSVGLLQLADKGKEVR